jgi:hypothetical protein
MSKQPSVLRSFIMLAVDARDLVKTFRGGWLTKRRTEALRGASLRVHTTTQKFRAKRSSNGFGRTHKMTRWFQSEART